MKEKYYSINSELEDITVIYEYCVANKMIRDPFFLNTRSLFFHFINEMTVAFYCGDTGSTKTFMPLKAGGNLIISKGLHVIALFDVEDMANFSHCINRIFERDW